MPRFAAACLALALAGCAARGLSPQIVAELGKAQARDMEVAAERSAQSAFNAAQGFARMGQKPLALAHVAMAIVHPRMKEKGEALKAAIEKMP